MPSGLQIWNAAGQLILDTNERVGRFRGTISLTATTPETYIDFTIAAGEEPWVYHTVTGQTIAVSYTSMLSSTSVRLHYYTGDVPVGGSVTIFYGVS